MSGKTPSGMVIPYLAEAIAAGNGEVKPFRAIVLSPSIVVNKWKREIKERIPNCEVFEITSLKDAIALKDKPKRPDKVEYYVISSEIPKHTFPIAPMEDYRYEASYAKVLLQKYKEDMKEYKKNGGDKPTAPRIRFNKTSVVTDEGSVEVFTNPTTSSFFCPKCGNEIRDKNRAKNENFFKSKTKAGWTPKNKTTNTYCQATIQVKNDKGFHIIPKGDVKYWTKLEGGRTARYAKQTCGYNLWQNKELPQESKNRKVSPIWYINKYLPRGFFKYLIADEVHEYKSGDTAVAQAFGQLINHTEKQVLLTGTLIGGMASNIFYLLARLNPKALERDGMDYEKISDFIQKYGVYEEKFSDETGDKRKTSRNEKPGLSPAMFAPYLMPTCTFLELADLGYALPKYQEIPLMIDMDEELHKAYNQLVSDFTKLMTDFKFASLCITLLYQYLDAPFECAELTHTDPDTGFESVIAKPQQFDRLNYTSAKLDRLIKLVDDEVYNQKRKVLVYAEYTGKSTKRSMDMYLYERLRNEGFKVGILRTSGSVDGISMPKNSKDREAWLERMMEKYDWDVLITNPRLVKVGLDLLQFPTIVYYQMGYSTYDYMQSSRRSWRIKQTEEVRVYTMVYKDTVQEQALLHVAQKIDSALAMQGKFSEEGLRAMSDNNDDTMMKMAKELMNEDFMKNMTSTIEERMARMNMSYEEMQKATYEEYANYEANPLGMEEIQRIRESAFNQLSLEAAAATTEEQHNAVKLKVAKVEEMAGFMEKLSEFIYVEKDVASYNKKAPKRKQIDEGQLTLDLF